MRGDLRARPGGPHRGGRRRPARTAPVLPRGERPGPPANPRVREDADPGPARALEPDDGVTGHPRARKRAGDERADARRAGAAAPPDVGGLPPAAPDDRAYGRPAPRPASRTLS